jgi:hypothetical protein
MPFYLGWLAPGAVELTFFKESVTKLIQLGLMQKHSDVKVIAVLRRNLTQVQDFYHLMDVVLQP